MPENKKKQQWKDSAPPDDWQDSGPPPQQTQPQSDSTIGPAQPRSLLQRAEDWWVNRPGTYEGVLGKESPSPRERAQSIAKGVGFGSTPLLIASGLEAPVATLLGLGGGAAGGIAGGAGGKYIGEKVGAPALGEDIGETVGGLAGGMVGGKATGVAKRALVDTTGRPTPIARLTLGSDRARALGELVDPDIAASRSALQSRFDALRAGQTAPGPWQPRMRSVTQVPAVRTTPFSGMTSSANPGGANLQLPPPGAAPAALQTVSKFGPLGGGRTSVLGGGSESAARASGSLVLTPSEAQAESQLGRIAKQRASERGMQFAGGMVPREGRSVPWSPTRYSDPEFSGVRERVPLTPLPGAEPTAPKALLGQGQFSSANKAALAQRSPAMDVPEWMQQERSLDYERLRRLQREGTPEEQNYANKILNDYQQ